jgi:glucans biosynthesis protein
MNNPSLLPFGPSRRAVLRTGLAGLVALAAGSARPDSAPSSVRVRFDDLVARARAAAAQPYVPPVVPAPDLIAQVDYSAHWQIRFRPEAALRPAGPDAPVQLFHPGRYFPEPVRIHLREPDGTAREVPFGPGLFTMPPDSPARALPDGFGFAGFRVMRPGDRPDWVSFLGASYFRTDGPSGQYGLSARGIAVNTGLDQPEEFPHFTAFWIGPPEAPDETLSVWAELDGPSVTGAFRFGLVRGTAAAAGEDETDAAPGHMTRVSARLFLRRDVERLGIAPLTSMYWYSERNRARGADWRPEIHDSDGLALRTGTGERVWRPLVNPPRLHVTSFADAAPRGFGLIQRDRDFGHYEDDGVFYDRRPSAWVIPRGDWGRGAVQLVEIPTGDETFDNIVAFWVPEQPVREGDALRFDYDIGWRARDPQPENVARVVATRQGQGGVPGRPIPPHRAKMVVDFAGPPLNGLDTGSGVEPVVEATQGRVVPPVAAYRVVGTDRWRLTFDFEQDGADPVSLRAYLRRNGQALTETWLTDAWVDMNR